MIAYRVVAIPERRERAEALAASVGAEIIWDETHRGTFPTHVRAIQSAPGSSHVVVLEDDAVLCPDFTAHVEALVSQRPEHLLGLYVGRAHPVKVQDVLAEVVETSHAWLDDPRVTDHLRWGVGYVMPTSDVPAVVEALQAGSQHKWLHADKRLGSWHAAHGRLSYPFPSPVDHDDTVRSTTSRSKRGRVAWAHCSGGASWT